ncbi:MAG: AEC family transporter [Dehalococcoidia bacterium]|nr:AEC family transporter [Dehalococcoidia bacterium]MDW8119340.1 AEC family transporter [Chloroflexota bacterium]
MPVLTVFLNVVLPVFLVAGVGLALQRVLRLNPGPLGQVVLYAFGPGLAFYNLATTTMEMPLLGRIALFTILLIGVMYVLGWGVARLLRLDRVGESSFLLTVVFMNAGNMGLSVALLAFGEEGLALALVFFIVEATLGNTLGIYLAARGEANPRQALGQVLRMPILYGAVLGLLANLTDVSVPQPILASTRFLSQATIPAMLIVLGLQLGTAWGRPPWKALGASLVLRLGVSVGVALVLVRALGLEGLAGKVMVVLAAMPTPVFVTIYATQFRLDANLLVHAVVVSSLASMVTLTALLWWLQ